MVNKKTKAIRNYIKYLEKRLIYINWDILVVSDNEAKYTNMLYKQIKIHTSKLLWKYYNSDITLIEFSDLLEIRPEKIKRYIEKKSDELYNKISKLENTIFYIFPYNDAKNYLDFSGLVNRNGI